jgi:hypothetical protein
MMARGLWIVMIAAVIGLGANNTWAEEFPDKWAVRAGGFLVRNFDTTIRLDAKGAPVGTSIDFGDTLGGDLEVAVARVDGYYRFNPRHRLDLSYYRIERKGSRFVNVDIQWGDQSFSANDLFESEIDTGVLKLGYTYSFYHNDDVELGVSAGLHTSSMRASLSNSSGQSQAESITAPLPVVGFLMDYHITPRWTAKLSTQYFAIDVWKVRGLLSDTLVATEYRFTRHLGAGLGFNHYGTGLELEGDNAVLTERSSFRGFLAYVSASF